MSSAPSLKAELFVAVLAAAPRAGATGLAIFDSGRRGGWQPSAKLERHLKPLRRR